MENVGKGEMWNTVKTVISKKKYLTFPESGIQSTRKIYDITIIN